MKLRYPITSELLTLDCAMFQNFERELRRQHELSILQYRSMSLMQQSESVEEACLIRDYEANASQLSKDLGELSKRGIVSWKSAGGSFKTWSLTEAGEAFLESVDNTVIQVYDRYFSGLEYGMEESAMPGLVMINQSRGIVRIKGERFFDEHTFFESILPFVHIVTKSSHILGLSPTQFRVLFELLEYGPALKAHLANRLMLSRSTVNWTCETLEGLGLVRVIAGKTGRVRPVLLTDTGRVTAENLAEVVDLEYCDLRVWSPEEKRTYQHVAEYFVKTFTK